MHGRCFNSSIILWRFSYISFPTERLKEKLLAEASVDFVCGPDAYSDLPRLLDSIISSIGSTDTDSYKAANTLLSMEETYADIRPIRL